MHEDRPAFGQRLAELAELGVIEFRPEPLDAIVERRLKALFLALRGLVITLLVLAATTVAYAWLGQIGYIDLYPPVLLLYASAVLLAILAIFTGVRAKEFSDDVVSYMISEFRVLADDESGEQPKDGLDIETILSNQ